MTQALTIEPEVASNPRAVAGNNSTPFDLVREEIDGLYTEAKNWLDGEGVNTEAEAENVSKLLDMLRQAEKRADKARVDEKKPHDDAAKAVQAKYKPLLDHVARAVESCKAALTPYLQKIERAKQEKARIAREEADALERAAQEAFAKSGRDDLEAREQAEALAASAVSAAATAKRAENDRAQAKGDSRAVSLRTTYHPEITDMRAFAAHVWTKHPAELSEFLDTLAAKLVRAGNRTLPGVTIHEEKEAV